MAEFVNSPSTGLGAIESNELVRRAHNGCADSYSELARRFRPRLLNLLRSRTSAGYGDAEDLIQETLARLFQNIYRFDPRYRFSTWVYTIALRLATDRARSELSRPSHLTLDEVDCDSGEPEVAERMQRQETVDNLWQTARRILSDAQYTTMWLRYAEDLSPIEVAQVMGKTRIAVRVLLHRARSVLVAE